MKRKILRLRTKIWDKLPIIEVLDEEWADAQRMLTSIGGIRARIKKTIFSIK